MLQGKPADYVFEDSAREARTYRELVEQLDRKYYGRETEKMYQNKWIQIAQKSGESEVDLAHYIKKVYSKAYPRRTGRIRREDLVSKFMDALIDHEARTMLEAYHKPTDIDEAVDMVVTLRVSKNRTRGKDGWRKRGSHNEEGRNRIGRVDSKDQGRRDRENSYVPKDADRGKPKERSSSKPQKDKVNWGAKSSSDKTTRVDPATAECFSCQQIGHFARDCPTNAARRKPRGRRQQAQTWNPMLMWGNPMQTPPMWNPWMAQNPVGYGPPTGYPGMGMMMNHPTPAPSTSALNPTAPPWQGSMAAAQPGAAQASAQRAGITQSTNGTGQRQ